MIRKLWRNMALEVERTWKDSWAYVNLMSGLRCFEGAFLTFSNCKYILEAKQYGNSKSIKMKFSSIQFSSVQFSRSAVSDSLRPHESQQPGLPVHHQLTEFTQTHVLRFGDAIQPSHLLLSLFPPAPNPSQHQSLFQWVNSSHEVAKVLEFQL